MSNEYAPTPPPPPPVFNINPISPYTWVKSRNTSVTRIPPRKSEIEKERERQRDYDKEILLNKLAARSTMVNNFIFYVKFVQLLFNLIFITFSLS